MLPSTAHKPPAVPDSPPDPPDEAPLDSQAISNKADEVIARLTAQSAPTPSASELDIRKRADDVIARLEAESRAKGTAPGQPGFYPRPPAPPPGFRPPPSATHLPAYPPFPPPPPPPHLFYPQPPQLGLRPPFPPFPHPSSSYVFPPPPFPGYPPLPPQPYAPRPPGWRPPPLPAFTLGAPMRIGFPAPPQTSALPFVGQGTHSPHLPTPPPPIAQPNSDRSPPKYTDPIQVSPEDSLPVLQTPSTLAANPKLQEVLEALSADATASSATGLPALATDAAAFINKATSASTKTEHPADESEVVSVEGASGNSVPVTPPKVSLDLRPSSDHPNAERQVFLGSLSSTTTLETLRKAFSPLSPIVRIELRTPFAMIEFEENGAAEMAVDIYDNGKLGGAIIRVERAATSPAEARKRPLDDHDLNPSEDSAIKRAR